MLMENVVNSTAYEENGPTTSITIHLETPEKVEYAS